MAPLTKRARIHDPDDPFLPEHILEHMILPRLPFKTLKRFQCISKRCRYLIAHDIPFASRQALLLSPSSSVLMQFSNKALSFLTNPEFVGLPDPSLKFLGDLRSNTLLCSTNGLLLFLCIRYGPYGQYEALEAHLCNPVTQEKVCVPIPPKSCGWINMGLAFDPSISPNRYKLVKPSARYRWGRLSYQFNVFRSDTGEWSLSKKKVYLKQCAGLSLKTVHTKGVIYWHFGEDILWYNTENDLAGSVPLPDGRWSVNVYAGWVVCCRRNVYSGLEVWRLTNGPQLDRLHCISWDCIGLPLDLCHLRQSCVKDVNEFECRPPFNPRNWLRDRLPLAFDGQFVYLADRLESGSNIVILWGYNIRTRQLEKKSVRLLDERGIRGIKLFDYHNSMTPIPEILEQTTD